MNRTLDFREAENSAALRQGLSQEKVQRLKQAQILRSLAKKSDFTIAAKEVAKNLDALAAFIRDRRLDYVQPGRCTEEERDRIEEQAGRNLRSCQENIARLEALNQEEAKQGGRGSNPEAPNASVIAHRHGVALALSERLQAIGGVFDRCRVARYQQLQQQQKKASHRKAQLQTPAGMGGGGLADTGVLPPPSASLATVPQAEQVQLQAENAALVAELASLSADATRTERTVREIATLNQMFSSQVMLQASQIEQLYDQALVATRNIERGNVHLDKAIALNTSARMYVVYIMLLASMMLLFFDWYAS
eukprot:jgi/Botrbrau1/18189/Bobra.53_1s0054.2